MVFLKEIFEKVDYEKKSADDKKTWKITQKAKSWQETDGCISLPLQQTSLIYSEHVCLYYHCFINLYLNVLLTRNIRL